MNHSDDHSAGLAADLERAEWVAGREPGAPRGTVVRTPWLHPGADLGGVLVAAFAGRLEPGEVVIVSEKAVVIAAGLAVPVASVVPSRLAGLLAERIRPVGDSRGLSVPAKMQYVVESLGRPRVLAAAGVAAATRPLGLRGGFFAVAGRAARALDGARPPFEHLLIPPLSPRAARVLARGLAGRVGAPVAIVDVNDRGGSVRAVSHRGLPRRRLLRALACNPLGQRDRRTPMGTVAGLRLTGAAARAAGR